MLRNLGTIYLCFVLAAGCENKQSELRLVTPVLPIDLEISTELAQMMDGRSAISIELTADALPDESAIDALLAGQADIALVSNNMPYRAGISTVLPLYPTVLHIGYRNDRSAENGTELIRGASVFAGAPGSASRLMFERIVSRLKLTNEDFSYVSDSTQAPDVFVVFAPVSPERHDELSGYRILSLGSPNDIGQGSLIDTTILLNPRLKPFVLPVGIYEDATPGPVLTVAVDMLLVARSDLSESVVYDFLHELNRLRPALAAQRPGLFETLPDDFNTSNSTFILHPGLVAYMERDEPSIYERYSGIAEVVVTLMIGFLTASFAGFRLYQLRRKNRIDIFYTDVIAIRNELVDASSRDQRDAAAGKIMALQDKAFEMLIQEKLSADESFSIFVSLSNDTLAKIRAKPGAG